MFVTTVLSSGDEILYVLLCFKPTGLAIDVVVVSVDMIVPVLFDVTDASVSTVRFGLIIDNG